MHLKMGKGTVRVAWKILINCRAENGWILVFKKAKKSTVRIDTNNPICHQDLNLVSSNHSITSIVTHFFELEAYTSTLKNLIKKFIKNSLSVFCLITECSM